MNDPKRTVRRLQTAENQRKCLELKLAGATFEDIARQMHFSSFMIAYRLYRRALANIPRKAAEEARTAMLERLDRLRLKVWSRFNDAENAADIAALTMAALRIEAREAHLLGLDAPRQLEVAQVQDVDEQERRQRQQEVLSKLSIPARAELLELMRKERDGDASVNKPNEDSGLNGKVKGDEI